MTILIALILKSLLGENEFESVVAFFFCGGKP